MQQQASRHAVTAAEVMAILYLRSVVENNNVHSDDISDEEF
jgi:hypothetical protein